MQIKPFCRGTAKTCPVCPLLGNCMEKTCPPAQDSCWLSQLQLANGTIIKNGSCVAPGDCREAVYSLTYGPGLSLWIHTACCEDNCSSVTPQATPTRSKTQSPAQRGAVPLLSQE
ncbi:hypothetical protein R6Z07F_013391 [Ovis aries]